MAAAVPIVDLPSTVEVTEIQDVFAVVEARTVEEASNVPKVGEVCDVQTKKISSQGTIAIYDADRPIPVIIHDIEYPTGEKLNVRITERSSSYLSAEPALTSFDEPSTITESDINLPQDTTVRIVKEGTPIDIRPLPTGVPRPKEIVTFDKTEEALIGAWDIRADSEGYEDLAVGDVIEINIASVDDTQVVGLQDGFPIICNTETKLPTDLSGKRIKIKIESIAPDRATANLVDARFKKGDVVSIKPSGSSGGDVFSVNEGHLIRIAASGLLPSEQTFRAGIKSVGPISRASVQLLPRFDPDEDNYTQVHLPATLGDITLVNEVPVKTKELPDLTKSVILGIDEVNPDHVVPSVSSLPDTNVPDDGDCLVVNVEGSTEGMTVLAVGEQLPIEVLKPSSVTLNRAYARVIDHGRNKLQAAVTTISENKSLEEVSEEVKLATSSLKVGEYATARSVFSRVRSKLPSQYPVIEAFVETHFALLCATDVFSNNGDSSPINVLQGASDKTSNREGLDPLDDIAKLLDAYDLELKTAIICTEAYENVDPDTVTQLQAIARGAEAKRPIGEAIQNLRTASHHVTGTMFESLIPSPEMIRFLHQFEEEFPYPVDELSSWISNQNVNPPSDELVDAVLPLEASSTQGTQFELTSNDEISERVWRRPLSANETVLGAPVNKNGESRGHTQSTSNQASTPENSVQTPPTEEDKDDAPDDTDIEVTTDTTSGSGSDTDTPSVVSEDASADTSTADSSRSTTAEQKKNSPSTNSQDTELTGSPRATESSASIPDNESEDGDLPETTVTNEIPDPTPKLRKLRKQAEADATKNPQNESSSIISGNQYQRSDKIREYTIVRADGQCEACGNAAPFKKPNGEPFLEVHHVDELGEGGADDPSLVVAVCPNCHREIHYRRHGDQLNEALRNLLEEGLGDVGAT